MSVYYIAGYPVSDELYHHGIKGQKWGVRRYQNADGTLTSEGRRRYGKALGEYAYKREGLVRKVATGNWLLGRKQLAERYENYSKRKAKDLKRHGRYEAAEEMKKTYEAQRQRNIDRDKYLSNTGTGKIIAQNLLLGFGADSYRVERQNNVGRGKAATVSILASIGGFMIGNYVDKQKSEKRYGRTAF